MSNISDNREKSNSLDKITAKVMGMSNYEGKIVGIYVGNVTIRNVNKKIQAKNSVVINLAKNIYRIVPWNNDLNAIFKKMIDVRETIKSGEVQVTVTDTVNTISYSAREITVNGTSVTKSATISGLHDPYPPNLINQPTNFEMSFCNNVTIQKDTNLGKTTPELTMPTLTSPEEIVDRGEKLHKNQHQQVNNTTTIIPASLQRTWEEDGSHSAIKKQREEYGGGINFLRTLANEYDSKTNYLDFFLKEEGHATLLDKALMAIADSFLRKKIEEFPILKKTCLLIIQLANSNLQTQSCLLGLANKQFSEKERIKLEAKDPVLLKKFELAKQIIHRINLPENASIKKDMLSAILGDAREANNNSSTYSKLSDSISVAKSPPPSISPLVNDQGLLIFSISVAISRNELTDGPELGAGGFGTVLQGSYKQKKVAIKKLQVVDDLKAFQTEVSIMARLDSQYVVRFYGACFEAPYYALVMEFMPNGSLYDFLSKRDSLKTDKKVSYQIAVDISHGLDYLHREKIIHGDLKSPNILLDEFYRAKIGDFGLAKVKSVNSTRTIMGPRAGGSMRWMSPELFEEKPKNTKESDVWSLGMVLWEIWSGKIPFKNIPDQRVPILIEKKYTEDISQVARHKPDMPKMASIIAQCWNERANERPAASKVVLVLEEEQQSLFNMS